jgi:hypothetical protein
MKSTWGAERLPFFLTPKEQPMNAEADYLVMNVAAEYWTGNGWSQEPDKAKDLTLADAARLAVKNTPTEIMMGDREILAIDHGVMCEVLCVWVGFPDATNRRYDDNEAAIKAICERGQKCNE